MCSRGGVEVSQGSDETPIPIPPSFLSSKRNFVREERKEERGGARLEDGPRDVVHPPGEVKWDNGGEMNVNWRVAG